MASPVRGAQSLTSMLITSTLVERWFATTQNYDARSTYRMHLEKMLTDDEVDLVKQVFSKYLCNQTVTWSSAIAYLKVSSPMSNK